MPSAPSVIAFLWLAFIFYWIVSARAAKPTIRGAHWWHAPALRLALAALVIAFLKFARARGFSFSGNLFSAEPAAQIAGALFCALGLSFAIWARVYLGTNWGMPMTVRENPDLVTNGPYRYVRHPIYTGMLVAVLGTSLANGTAAILVFLIAAVYAAYSATTEEKLMTQRFPDQYPAYKKRTKMFIPFVW